MRGIYGLAAKSALGKPLGCPLAKALDAINRATAERIPVADSARRAKRVRAPRCLPSKRQRAPATLARNPHEDADGEPTREHERSSVAEERKRDPGDRHQIERHSHVHEYVYEPA